GLLGSLVNAVTSSLNARTSLSAILIVPGSIPLLIAATNALEATTYGRGILPWLLLLLAVNLGLGIAVVVLAGPIDDL
ncbi:MAG: heme exporter protein CcmB, partial [Acidimicrobiia bacterium]|nr:heme exporter protein CcmB [Acidimicrobiia bacterium]NNL28162.1 ABC transporter permease [Acidimicrobiia bacterium]